MIIFADNLIPFEEIFNVKLIEDIRNTKAYSTVLFFFDEGLTKYCYENELSFAVIVSSIKEAIYSNSLGAKYIISSKQLAKKLQKIADNYMYDSKILAIISTNDEFEEVAKNEVDGAIYQNLIK